MKQLGSSWGRGAQEGVAMAVCLILLLVMTVIGIASMSGASLEIKMAGLMQQEEIALRRAERTLVAAEDAIETIAATTGRFEFGASGDGYYLPEDELDARVADWSHFSHLAGPVSTDDDRDNDDAYVVEYLGPMVIPGETIKEETDAPVAGALAYVYRTTIRSASTEKSVRIIESLYTTADAP